MYVILKNNQFFGGLSSGCGCEVWVSDIKKANKFASKADAEKLVSSRISLRLATVVPA